MFGVLPDVAIDCDDDRWAFRQAAAMEALEFMAKTRAGVTGG